MQPGLNKTQILELADTIRSELDKSFYMQQLLASGILVQEDSDFAEHYIQIGASLGLDPCESFSTSFYLRANPDVENAKVNPFWHYIVAGRIEGRISLPPADSIGGGHSNYVLESERIFSSQAPQPAAPADSIDEQMVNANIAAMDPVIHELANAIRDSFDNNFYLQQILERGIETGDISDLSAHYIQIGSSLGLDPTKDFSTSFYLSSHSDVANAKVNPFWHYVVAGRQEGRAASPALQSEETSSYETQIITSAFDRDFYLASYPDVAAAGIDPLLHFVQTGWIEGRNPNWQFSVSDYLESYPDIKAAGINPFYHYLTAGRLEGRSPKQNLGFRYEILKNLKSVEEMIEDTIRHFPPGKVDEPVDLRRKLTAQLATSKGLVITVSHDNFTANIGGVQLCLMRESSKLMTQGFTHLHLFPYVPLPVVASHEKIVQLGVVLNGTTVGTFDAATIDASLSRQKNNKKFNRIVIHSMLGHKAENIISIAKAASISKGWFWIHDFASVCAGYNLLRNDVEYCASPEYGSGACLICKYSQHRPLNVAAYSSLFSNFELEAVAPSQSALDVWSHNYKNVATATHIQHHCLLKNRKKKPPKRSGSALRIAFLGYPVAHKGWYVFRDLVQKFGSQDDFEFFHLGKQRDPSLKADFHEVAVTQKNRNAMTNAIRDLKIDVALVWSMWPETFCFTAYEAMAGGAAVFTSGDSGNVVQLVRNEGIGKVFESEEEISNLLTTAPRSAINKLLSRDYFELQYSGMTADLIGTQIT